MPAIDQDPPSLKGTPWLQCPECNERFTVRRVTGCSTCNRGYQRIRRLTMKALQTAHPKDYKRFHDSIYESVWREL